jgi:translation initiation factor 5B
MRASIMLEKGKPEYATILAFDVRIDADARAYAEETGVRIFTADIIYHLFDQVSSTAVK